VKSISSILRIGYRLLWKTFIPKQGTEEWLGPRFQDHRDLGLKQGSLSAHIKESGVLPEGESQWYTNQMLQGIKFLHSQNVTHRDIKAY